MTKLQIQRAGLAEEKKRPLQPPFADIIIVTYNAKRKLIRCLRSVIRHTAKIPYQLTVLDNASTDGTSAYLKKHFSKNIRLIQSKKNLGFSGGANLALAQTNCPWVVLLDDDAEVTSGWFLKLYSLAKKDPKTGMVGGRVVFPNGRIFCAEYSITPFGSMGRGERDRGQRSYIKETDALPGPCWLMPRHVIEKVGKFDERFFPSQFEDIDYCLRVRRAGYKIFYHGKVKIIHHNLFRIGRPKTSDPNGVKFFKKWRGTLDQFPFCPLNHEDRLITVGARFLRRESFCPVYEISGKRGRLNGWFSPSFYRGIAHWAARRYKKAALEFRAVASADRRYLSRITNEALYIDFILFIYFSRLGLKKDAQKCVQRLRLPFKIKGIPASLF